MAKIRITVVGTYPAEDPIERIISLALTPGSDEQPAPELHSPHHWRYQGKTYRVEGADHSSTEEIALRIKHQVLKEAKEINRIRREVDAFENFDRAAPARRERIPERMRMFVWQRDEGKCVECGSRERLEFDHVIPVIEGGATTERNIQLLCEVCNRHKGRRV